MTSRTNKVILRVWFVYEYETDATLYPEDQQEPRQMAQYDLDTDPAIMFENDGVIERVEMTSP